MRDGDRDVVLCVSLQRPGLSQSNCLLFAVSRRCSRSRVLWWTEPVGAYGLPRGWVAGCWASSAACTVRAPGLPRDGAGPVPARPVSEIRGQPWGSGGTVFLRRWASGQRHSAGEVRLRTQTRCGSLPWARLNLEAVLLLYLRSVQQAALETSSGPGVLAWPAGAAYWGHQHCRRGCGHRSVGPWPAPQSGLTTWHVWSRTEGLKHGESRAETVDVMVWEVTLL